MAPCSVWTARNSLMTNDTLQSVGMILFLVAVIWMTSRDTMDGD